MANLATGLVFVSVCTVFITCEEIVKSNRPTLGRDTKIAQDKIESIVGKDTTFVEDSKNSQPDDDIVSGVKEVFATMKLMGLEVSRNSTEVSVSARMKMSDIMFNPMMMVPQLIMWGFAPIALANLKMLVMQALMINNMALSSAIFMTLRNIVFGPRPGPVVKYANYGYGHGQNKFQHYHRRS